MITDVSGIDPTYPDEPLLISADQQTWDAWTIQELRDRFNIIFDGNIHAIMIKERKNCNPLFIIGYEDDGMLFFDRVQWNFRDYFDAKWADSFAKLLNEASHSIQTKEDIIP